MCHTYYVVRRHYFYDINHPVIKANRIILWARKEVIPSPVGQWSDISVSDWFILSPYSMMENDKLTSGKEIQSA